MSGPHFKTKLTIAHSDGGVSSFCPSDEIWSSPHVFEQSLFQKFLVAVVLVWSQTQFIRIKHGETRTARPDIAELGMLHNPILRKTWGGEINRFIRNDPA
jgi:hypothetical protein